MNHSILNYYTKLNNMKLKTNKDVQLDEPIYTGIVFEWAN